jgi:hypothetical protein
MMVKDKFLRMIDEKKVDTANPLEVLEWTRLKVFIMNIPDEIFEAVLRVTHKDMEGK